MNNQDAAGVLVASLRTENKRLRGALNELQGIAARLIGVRPAAQWSEDGWPRPHPGDPMTLLEDLEEAAADLEQEYPARAARLRAAATRIREEMALFNERYAESRKTPLNLDGVPLLIQGAVIDLLLRINNGPVKP